MTEHIYNSCPRCGNRKVESSNLCKDCYHRRSFRGIKRLIKKPKPKPKKKFKVPIIVSIISLLLALMLTSNIFKYTGLFDGDAFSGLILLCEVTITTMLFFAIRPRVYELVVQSSGKKDLKRRKSLVNK